MRLLPIVASLVLAATLTAPVAAKPKHTPMPSAGGTMTNMGGSMGSAMSGGTKRHSCPPGQHWVKPYMRNGKMVSGYCRKVK